MTIDWTQVAKDMAAAAKKSASGDWADLKQSAESEFQALAQVAANIERRKIEHTITEVNARFLMKQHRSTTEVVLFASEGIANIVIERAINAALGVLATAVNTSIGWTLL